MPSAYMKRKAKKLVSTDGTKVVASGRYWSDADQQWKYVGFDSVDSMAEWQAIMGKLEGVRHNETT